MRVFNFGTLDLLMFIFLAMSVALQVFLVLVYRNGRRNESEFGRGIYLTTAFIVVMLVVEFIRFNQMLN